MRLVFIRPSDISPRAELLLNKSSVHVAPLFAQGSNKYLKVRFTPTSGALGNNDKLGESEKFDLAV